jgi:microcystin-dependent protein
MVPVSSDDATTEEANGQVVATAGSNIYSGTAASGQHLQAFNTANTGANSPVNIMAPYLVVNYCIALQGVYPSRS